MDNLRETAHWADCDRIGIAAVRAKLASPIASGIHEKHVRIAWLEEAERREQLAANAKQLSLTERSVSAAESSAMAAVDSAKTSATSARAALFAAIVSFFALVVAIAAYFK